jgi:hypothetical protein
MPPSRPRPHPEDSRSEASSTKEKTGSNTATAINGKGRRTGSSALAGSSLRDVVTAVQSGTVAGGSGSAISELNPGVSFVFLVLHLTAFNDLELDSMVYFGLVNSARLPIRLPFEYSCRVQ